MIFNAFERMVALRYLRARREEGFVSVIAGFSLAGIALGWLGSWVSATRNMRRIEPGNEK